MGPPASTSTRVIEEIARRSGSDPTDLDPPLYDRIDLDALEALLSPSYESREPSVERVEFRYDGYEVVVEGSGRIDVEEVGDAAGSDASVERDVSVD